MWKDSKQVKKRQKTKGQLGGEVVVEVAIAIGEEAVKEEEGEIWDEEVLDALFNEIVQYLVINSYISAIIKLYIQQLENKVLLPLQGVKLLVVLKSIYCNKD